MQFYDIPSNVWRTPAAPLPRGINHPNAAVVGNKVYLLGGLAEFAPSQWTAVPDCWVYDTGTDSWHSLTPIPSGLERGSASIGVYGTTIVLAGGMELLRTAEPFTQATVNTVIAFDTISRTWLTLPEAARRMPARRDHAGFAVVGHTFYVLGGRDKGQRNVRDTVFALDLDNMASGWIIKDGRLPIPRGGACGCRVG
jgi:hypothetical protein